MEQPNELIIDFWGSLGLFIRTAGQWMANQFAGFYDAIHEGVMIFILISVLMVILSLIERKLDKSRAE